MCVYLMWIVADLVSLQMYESAAVADLFIEWRCNTCSSTANVGVIVSSK